jgi:hypothetical protein
VRAFASFAFAASAACAQSPALDLQVDPGTARDCGSKVVLRCASGKGTAAAPGGDPERTRAAREAAQRRSDAAAEDLGRVVIEGERIRTPSVEQVISKALERPIVRDGTHSFEIGEGAQCTCMNVCPPWPLPCCSCSGHASSYIRSPWSQILY